MSKPKPASSRRRGPRAFAEKSEHALRLAHRPAGADGEAGDGAVDAEERQFEQAGAEPVRLQRPAEGRGQRGEGGGDVRLGDRLGEAPLGEEGGRRAARVDSSSSMPSAWSSCATRPAEAGGKRGARLADDLADALEADAIERGDGVMVEAKRGQGAVARAFARCPRAGRH